MGVRGSPSFCRIEVGLKSTSIARPRSTSPTMTASSSCITSSVNALTTESHPRPDLTSTFSHSQGREDSSKRCEDLEKKDRILVG
jgi:hypothetical protein